MFGLLPQPQCPPNTCTDSTHQWLAGLLPDPDHAHGVGLHQRGVDCRIVAHLRRGRHFVAFRGHDVVRLQKRLGGGEITANYKELISSWRNSQIQMRKNGENSPSVPGRRHPETTSTTTPFFTTAFWRCDVISDSLFLSLQRSVGQRGLSRQLTAPTAVIGGGPRRAPLLLGSPPPLLILYWCTS